MHLYAMTRGINKEVLKWVDECSETYWGYGPSSLLVQLALRPIQLWEIVFPKVHLQSVLSTISGSPIDNQDWKKQLIGMGFRKFLGADKIPDFDMSLVPKKVKFVTDASGAILKDASGANIIEPVVKNYCVGVDWIGTRDDPIWPDGVNKGYEQL